MGRLVGPYGRCGMHSEMRNVWLAETSSDTFSKYFHLYQNLILFLRAGSSWRRLGNGKHEGRGAELLALCGTSLPCDRGHQPCLVGHCPSDCLGHCPCLMGHCPVCSTLFKCWDTTPSLGHFPYFLGHCPAPRNCPCLLRLRKTDRLAQNCSWLQNYQ